MVCAPGEGQCTGHVDVIEYVGADTLLPVARFVHGAAVGLAFSEDKCHFAGQDRPSRTTGSWQESADNES